MNNKLKFAIVGALGLVAGGAYNSIADVLVTAGAGTTVFDFVCFATKHCPTAVLTNSAGTEIATAGAPVRIDPTGTTPQPVTMTSTTITGTVAATESGTWTVQPGNTANTTPWLVNANAGTNLNTSALALEAGGNLAAIKPGTDRLISSATNITAGSPLATTSFVTGSRYLSTPPTFTNGQEGAFQIDANGRQLVTANATLGAETTKVIGTVRNQGNLGGVMDAIVGGTYPANAMAVGVLNGANIGRLVGDETSGLWVNIKAGAGSGGTALADKSAWTVSSTNLTPIGGEFTTGGATACATAQACAVAMTATRGLFHDMNTWAETSLGVPTAYGTAPTTGNYIGVNAFVTNATPLGQTTKSASSPVTLASDQIGDPCTWGVKTNIPISTTSGTLQLVAPSGSTQVYVCSIVTVGATASIQNLVGGTGATCTTGTPVAAIGSTTAANGMSFAANGGFSYGSGAGTVARTTTAGHGLCLIQSATAQISGNAIIVQQ